MKHARLLKALKSHFKVERARELSPASLPFFFIQEGDKCLEWRDSMGEAVVLKAYRMSDRVNFLGHLTWSPKTLKGCYDWLKDQP